MLPDQVSNPGPPDLQVVARLYECTGRAVALPPMSALALVLASSWTKCVHSSVYRIYSAIRWVFSLSRMSTNNQISPMQFCYTCNTRLPFLNNPKDLDPSYKMDLDFWDCFGRTKTPPYRRRNTVCDRVVSGELPYTWTGLV